MYPVLFSAGPITLYSYGVLLVVSALLGLELTRTRARHRHIDDEQVLDLSIVVIIAAMLGARLLLLLLDLDDLRHARAAGMAWLAGSGGVFYGGLIAAIGAALWFTRRRRMPLWASCDLFAPGIALGYVAGRIGCLAAGCCYGRPANVAWAITFTNPLAAANVGTPLGVPLHPTQLYEAAASLMILIVLLALERRTQGFAGRTFWSYMLLYAAARFAIEFFRGDPRGSVFGVLSTSQFISLLLAPISAFMLVRLARATPGGEWRRSVTA